MHDKNDKELAVGDVVTVKFRILRIESSPEYCNISTETVEPMYPGPHKTSVYFNAKQVEKL